LRVFGLTGGIASGKSLVLDVFRREGVACVDADAMARKVVEPGTDGLAAIVAEFGSSVLTFEGSLDRKKVAAIVFGDEGARRKLNAIIHPRVALASQEEFARAAARGHVLGCYDAALLVESGAAALFRPLIVVAARPEMQKARLMARDGLTSEEADARLEAQAPLDKKLAAADLVIWNDADLASLEQRARDALAEVRRRVASR
jgi:dephospho-CoA kinase